MEHQASQPAGERTEGKPRTTRAFPYPDLPPAPGLDADLGDRPLFWRAAWLKVALEQQAFERFCLRGDYSRKPRELQMAIYKARSSQRDELAEMLTMLREAGGLLYAWLPNAKGQPS